MQTCCLCHILTLRYERYSLNKKLYKPSHILKIKAGTVTRAFPLPGQLRQTSLPLALLMLR